MRSDWVRLRTLIALRWLAIAGQLAAVLAAALMLEVEIPLDLTLFVILASVCFNMIAAVLHPENKRLSERDTTLTLLFDLIQLALLLYLCGGLTNPFASLMLAPVIIAATALTLRATIALGATALVFISLLAFIYRPLSFADGRMLELPEIYLLGMWAALVIAVVFLALYARRVTTEIFSMSQALTATQMALAREQRLTALGGVVAAAAHELGTPLATIKLTAAELANDLAEGGETEALREDAALIVSQAERCREILQSMGRAGKDDTHLHHAPISAVVEEAAEPHFDRGKRIILRVDGVVDGETARDQPEISRHPEVIHGLRNLVQNAVDFARTTVWIDVNWNDETLRVRVGDDGLGFPPDLLGRIGDPFLRHRPVRDRRSERPAYEGMGLGLFIAKTLLERSGATLTFANGTETPGRTPVPASAPLDLARPTGALADVVWPRAVLAPSREAVRGPLARNTRFDLREI
ncbi:MAG: ActS/PrrB/RegB family redox-sensitive histidine kinase [Pseudomonadota bacterium]